LQRPTQRNDITTIGGFKVNENSTSKANPTPPSDGKSVWEQLHAGMARLSANASSALDPAALANKLAHRAKLLRDQTADTKATETSLQFLAFNSGHESYGIPLSNVLEIQILQHFSPVPKTPPFIAGVVHWRGAILALLDLDRLFGLPESGLPDLHACVIVEAAGRRIGLVASEIEDVFSVPSSRIQAAPPLSANVPPEWIIGVHDNQRVILNMASLLQDTRLVEWRNNS
jgi:purine-binding chemotaxis protein CheW